MQAWEMAMSRGTGVRRAVPASKGGAGLDGRLARNASSRLRSFIDVTRSSAASTTGPRARLRSARRSVFWSSMAMVMGPTPPGTGVILEQTFFAAS